MKSDSPTNVSRTAPRSRGRRFKLACLTMAVASVVGCLLAEAALRVLGIGQPLLYQPDAVCGSRLQPFASGTWTNEGRGYIEVNSLGFRGPEIAAEKPAGTIRIAVLGDSFIEALQVDYKESLCGQLHTQLNAGESGRTYEVINCGVSGYGTAQQLLMLRHHVKPLQIDAVVLAVYPENDVRNNFRTLEQDNTRPYFVLDENEELILDESFRQSPAYIAAASDYERSKASVINSSRLLQVLHGLRQGKFAHASSASIEDRLKMSVKAALYTYSEPKTDDERLAWQTTEKLLKQISDENQRLPLLVVSVSSPAQVYPEARVRNEVKNAFGLDDLFYSERRLREFCVASNIRFLPLASELRVVADETGEFLHGFENLQVGRGHWNKLGNKTAAGIIARWISIDAQFP